jgi:hypothetical protein
MKFFWAVARSGNPKIKKPKLNDSQSKPAAFFNKQLGS